MSPPYSRRRRPKATAFLRCRARGGAPLSFALALATVLGVTLLAGSWAAPAAAAPTETGPVHIYGTAKAQIDSLETQAQAVQAEIDALDVELERHTESYNELSVKLDQINVRMTELRRQLKQAEIEHAAHVKRLEERLRAVYKAGGRDQLLQIILLADGLEDLFNRIRLVSTLADQDRRIVSDVKDSTKLLDALLGDIDTRKRDELSIRRQLNEERGQIQAKLLERQQILAGIDSQIATVVEQERQRQAAEQERLRQSLLRLINGGQQYTGPLPQTDSAILNQFVETAATYMGIAYVWAGDRPSTGFDCSGFTQYVYRQHGINLPHYSGYQAQMGIPVDPAHIQPGDLVAFGYPVHHVGIYIGNGLFLHAPRTGDVVKISPMSEKTNLSAIRRFPIQPRFGVPAVG